jgi:hypothetical protein
VKNFSFAKHDEDGCFLGEVSFDSIFYEKK